VNAPAGTLPEPRLNALLRAADWRFLLPDPEPLRILDLTGGESWPAAALVGRAAAEGEADLALAGTGSAALRRARAALRPGGTVLCRLRYPLPGGTRLLRRRLRRAGFDRVRLYWPGPSPTEFPQFWLSLDAPAAAERLLSMRPPQGPVQQAVRLAWTTALKSGSLAPLYALAQLEGGGDSPQDELSALLPSEPSWLLLTGGQRSINKVVGLPFGAAGSDPDLVVKFARVDDADAALQREAAALEAVAERRPGLAGVPRARALGRRGGRLALAESVVAGQPLIERLTAATLPELSAAVTEWLLELAGTPRPRPQEEWWQRLVGRPLDRFGDQFGTALGAAEMSRLRLELEGLGEMPLVCEHRDCSPWNVVMTEAGPALHDWESAEPLGLPGLDLTYFLANAAFLIDGALAAGSLEPRRAAESYLRLLDPATATGRIATARLREYGEGLGLDEGALHRLRLLCWVVHSSSEHRHLEMEAAGPPSLEARRGAAFLALLRAELNAT